MGALSSHEDRNHYQFLFFFCLFFFFLLDFYDGHRDFFTEHYFYTIPSLLPNHSHSHPHSLHRRARTRGSQRFLCVAQCGRAARGLSTVVLLSCAALCVALSPVCARGFYSESTPEAFLRQDDHILVLVVGKLLLISFGQGEKRPCLFVSSSNVVAAFQTRFAAQNDHHAQQGSSNNSLPMACGQMGGFFFYMKALHSTSLKRETVCTPTELSAELCHHFTAKSVSRADLSPALPLVSARMEAHLLFSAF